MAAAQYVIIDGAGREMSSRYADLPAACRQLKRLRDYTRNQHLELIQISDRTRVACEREIAEEEEAKQRERQSLYGLKRKWPLPHGHGGEAVVKRWRS